MSPTLQLLSELGAQSLGTVLVASGLLKLLPGPADSYSLHTRHLHLRIPRILAGLLEAAVGVGVFCHVAPLFLLPAAGALIASFFFVQLTTSGACACFGPLSVGKPSKAARLIRLGAMAVALTAASLGAGSAPNLRLPEVLVSITLGFAIIGVGEINFR